jgi:hypothetical protein
MAGTHSVGSLFVNISGSTKGLTRALGAAKKKISGFGSSSIKEQEKVVRQAAQRAADAIQDMRLAGMSGDPKALLHTRKASVQAGRGFRSEKAELTRMQAAKTMRMTFGILGVGLAAVTALFREGFKRGGQALESHKPFAMLGPSGGRSIDAQIGMIMDKLAFAQSSRGSEVMAKQSELQRREEELNRQWAEITIGMREMVFAVTNFFIGMRTPEETRVIYENSQRRQETGHGKTGVG